VSGHKHKKISHASQKEFHDLLAFLSVDQHQWDSFSWRSARAFCETVLEKYHDSDLMRCYEQGGRAKTCDFIRNLLMDKKTFKKFVLENQNGQSNNDNQSEG
jgi:hypothetical protein